ncbi:MAG: PEP/pyruvate-binding domain-containing protein [Caldisericia bacterium]
MGKGASISFQRLPWVFSNNEIRWSSRISREDGVVRLVAGLGTRAVDRVAGDYPTLASPGQPKIRVNTIPSEVEKYSQKYIDVINTETGEFETLEIKQLLKEVGDKYPQLYNVFSSYSDGFLKQINPLTDIENEDLVVTFDGLFNNTPFLKQIKLVLDILQESLQTPVDVEFASDGTNLYILQCRPQYVKESLGKIEIPKNIPREDIVFDAIKSVSEGICNNIEYIVYVDPMDYEALESREEMLKVGQIVSELNSSLPEKRFILMGPGRWGSRGDIKLGVSITYSGISKTAALIEIARKKQSYVPEVSFGTHFFQDLVESDISYLPLYPDDVGRVFNQDFLRNSENQLLKYVPWAKDFVEVVRVIDVRKVTGGRKMKLIMDADENYAVAFLTSDE